MWCRVSFFFVLRDVSACQKMLVRSSRAFSQGSSWLRFFVTVKPHRTVRNFPAAQKLCAPIFRGEVLYTPSKKNVDKHAVRHSLVHGVSRHYGAEGIRVCKPGEASVVHDEPCRSTYALLLKKNRAGQPQVIARGRRHCRVYRILYRVSDASIPRSTGTLAFFRTRRSSPSPCVLPRTHTRRKTVGLIG